MDRVAEVLFFVQRCLFLVGVETTLLRDMTCQGPDPGMDWTGTWGLHTSCPEKTRPRALRCSLHSSPRLHRLGPVAGGQQKVSVLSAAKCLVLRTMALHDSQEKSRGHCPLSCHYHSQPCQPSRRCSNRIHCSEQG